MAAPAAPVRAQTDPKITIAANRDTIIAGLEVLTWTVAREAPLEEALTVTVRLTQEQNWLSDTSRGVTFAANEATADLRTVASSFSSSVTESGNLTATVDSVNGYDTGDATATVYLFSQNGPAMKVFLSQEDYRFAEDAAAPFVTLVVRAAAGMPRGATVTASLSSRGGTATSPGDYEVFSKVITVSEGDFTLEDGRWSAQARLPVTLVDDEVREGAESFDLLLEGTPGHPVELQLSDPGGSECPGGGCLGSVEITDDEDIPEWELSVNPESIMEEDESSSTATVSITNGKSFAADQAVTFAFAGTATEGVDYVVTPVDADQQAASHQVILSAGSASLDVTLTAADDDLTESNEEIEVSATHEGEAIGSTQTIPILDQERPAITLFANRDTIIAGLEDLLLTATREAPLDEALTVTVHLTQAQNWLSNTSISVTIQAGSAIHELGLGTSLFSQAVTESGTITATVDSIDGYDTSDATASLFVVSQEGPAVSVSLTHSSYLFSEDDEDTDLILRAQMASGMPRGATVAARVKSRGKSSSRPTLTATSGSDYQAFDETLILREQDYSLENGIWVARQHLPVTLLDDDVREGRERFRAVLDHALGYEDKIQLLHADTSVCPQGDCPYPVFIVDDEDIPELYLSLSAEEIREEEEMSSTATVSITNGKTFAADQVVTFAFAGTATEDSDYRVAPADADDGAGHQVVLAGGSNSVEVTFTAQDDDREEGDEKIRIRATHGGAEIGSADIRIIDRFPGPRVEITFEGVQPPRDEYDAGIATGPFTARFTFSEPVSGFTEEDIDWDTHWLTTVDSTLIGVLMWDYTEVRPGLEYTARMMPDQDGRLWIGVDPGATRSVATGDGNQLGLNSLWVELPPNRLMVAPTELTVVEGDGGGAEFLVVPTSPPTGEVTVMVTGTDGTDLEVDWSTWTFGLPYWNGGWVVRVTSAHDADTANEQVRLWVKASGGGYDGRGADLVVNIRDDDGASADLSRDLELDQDALAEALTLLEGVTPEMASAALFGEHDLAEAQLGALDLLGNANGGYDLGDLLSWVARRGIWPHAGQTRPGMRSQ